MKTNILILLLSFSIGVFAQHSSDKLPPNHPKKEKIEAMRIAFLTKKLDLSPTEAQQFWPVYNEFQKKKDILHKKKNEGFKNKRTKIDSLSDSQVEALVDAEIVYRQNSLELEKEYHGKFKSVLPIKKVAKLYRAKQQFTHRLLEHMSERGKKGYSHGDKKGGSSSGSRSHEIEKGGR